MLNSGSRRLAFLITGLGRGGAEVQLLRLATGMRARNWDVHVISVVPPRAVAGDFATAGIPVSSLGIRQSTPDPRAPLRLGAILRRLNPHVVHSHMVHANLLARVSRPLYRAPVLVCTVHSVHEGSTWRDVGIRVTDGLCDLTTGVSNAVVERYLRSHLAPRHKVRVLHNGIDTSIFRPRTEDRAQIRQDLGVDNRFVWLAVGGMRRAKDYPTLLQAFARLRATHPTAVLLIAGDGPERDACEFLITQLGIENSVCLLGVREDIPQLMNGADAFVMSSAWEGLGMVLQEASATGLPIVATDVGGIPDVVENEKTGFLIRAQDPDGLAHAMARLMDLPGSERRLLGLRGRHHVEQNFAMEEVLESWERLYLDLLGAATSESNAGHGSVGRPSALPSVGDPTQDEGHG